MEEVDKKAERQKKKTERQQGRIDKYKAGLSVKAKEEGVDMENPINIGPLGAERKAEIDKRITASVDEDKRKGLNQFQSRFKELGVKTPTKPTYDPTIKDVRRAKWAKTADALTAFSQGMAGTKVNATGYRDRLTGSRLKQFQQYKDASEASKKQLDDWSEGYLQKQLDYLNGLKKDNGMSDLKKQKIQAEIDRIKVATKWQKNKPYRKNASSKSSKTAPIYTHKTKENNWQMTNQGTPYSDLYYKLAVNSPVIVNEVAKLSGHAVDETGSLKRNLSTAEVERFSNLLLSKAFEFKVDENGNQVAVPRPGKEAFMQDLSSFMDKTNTFRAKIKDLNEQRDDELYKVNNTWGIGDDDDKAEINAKYDGLVADIQSQLTSSESELKSMINEGGDKKSSGKKSVTKQEATELRKSGEWEMVKDKAGDAYLRNKSNHKELKKISK